MGRSSPPKVGREIFLGAQDFLKETQQTSKTEVCTCQRNSVTPLRILSKDPHLLPDMRAVRHAGDLPISAQPPQYTKKPRHLN